MTLTFDPANKGANVVLSTPGWGETTNLIATSGTAAWQTAKTTVSQSSGKWYVEFIFFPGNGSINDVIVGLCNSSATLASFLGSDANGIGLQGQGSQYNTGGTSGWGGNWLNGHVAGIAFDVGTKKFWCRKNGGAWLNGDPVAATGGGTWPFAGAVFPAVSIIGSPAAVFINGGVHPLSAAAPSGYSTFDSTGTLTTVTQQWDTTYSDSAPTYTLSNTKITFAATASPNSGWRTAQGAMLLNSGTYYYEFTIGAITTGLMIGVSTAFSDNQDYLGSGDNLFSFGWQSTGSVYYNNTSQGAIFPSYTAGDVLGMAIDFRTNGMWFRKNLGSWFSGAPPAPWASTGTYVVTQSYFPMAANIGLLPMASGIGTGTNLTANFSQTGLVFPNPFVGVPQLPWYPGVNAFRQQQNPLAYEDDQLQDGWQLPQSRVLSRRTSWTTVNMSVSKTLAYSVMAPPDADVSVSKTLAYSVLAPPDADVNISKSVLYVVTESLFSTSTSTQNRRFQQFFQKQPRKPRRASTQFHTPSGKSPFFFVVT